ncbi:hypothetical protein AGLY_007541 [Aphis glycines]|uniref:Uncharacterized protein n=1 Tax=Aphis glycines TaxID=307491 RepID=A0A6G0TPK4_APHGL|nr:hypothetical protein AGLY_007541 [Aphis glycines]
MTVVVDDDVLCNIFGCKRPALSSDVAILKLELREAHSTIHSTNANTKLSLANVSIHSAVIITERQANCSYFLICVKCERLHDQKRFQTIFYPLDFSLKGHTISLINLMMCLEVLDNEFLLKTSIGCFEVLSLCEVFPLYNDNLPSCLKNICIVSSLKHPLTAKTLCFWYILFHYCFYSYIHVWFLASLEDNSKSSKSQAIGTKSAEMPETICTVLISLHDNV